jgi:sulfonate transport system permease protein
MKRLLGSTALQAAAFALGVLLLWQLASDAKIISPIFFPPPSKTLAELYRQIVEGLIWKPLAETTVRMFYGWMLASLLGIVLGAAIGSSRLAREMLHPLLEFVRPLPASAIIPPAILFLGLSNTMAVSVIAFGAIWPVLLASVFGFASISQQLQDVAAVLRLSRTQYLWKIAVPSALPDILAGARVSLAIALILAVVTEMQASQPGLGQNILLAQRTYRSPELYAGVVTLGALGFFINYALQIIERRALRWRPAV